MELHGDQVILRPATEDDAEALFRIVREPSVDAWWSVPEDFEDTFVILVDGQLAGAVQYAEENEPEYRHAGIDIFLTTGLQGRGIGTDAVRTLARWLIDERGHHRLTIDPAADNAPAVRSYTKVGFRPVGVLRRYWRDHHTGEWRDGLLMDLLAEELT
ncbi:aminoglycoside 6'-N-acetyltransferase [Streptomyces sp. HNM0574]|uniref:aminoglycoside 6'-N-acetyltransferase n=1 Tax=Streptomyces sp. HNM0574 TaxID=2714954 RepID=UPI00146DB025|nr:aminoglycoside 6'-N-acetyltransferase [Streptomyces sp. HNM0574]NLU69316.1 aminoglycoside 6'-N-acetyltransferase [Streptomyces sp. HNM0574]